MALGRSVADTKMVRRRLLEVLTNTVADVGDEKNIAKEERKTLCEMDETVFAVGVVAFSRELYVISQTEKTFIQYIQLRHCKTYIYKIQVGEGI